MGCRVVGPRGVPVWDVGHTRDTAVGRVRECRVVGLRGGWVSDGGVVG